MSTRWRTDRRTCRGRIAACGAARQTTGGRMDTQYARTAWRTTDGSFSFWSPTLRRTYSDDEIRAALEASRGNIAATARALGANERSLRRRLKAMKGDLEAPDGFKVTGKSTLIDRRTGETVLEWVKVSRDAERKAEMLREVAEALASKLPRERPAKAPETGDADLLNCFVVTDYHLGMYSWAEETGDDWDTDIAEGLLVDWFAAAIRSAPNADTAIFAQLGD